MNRRIDENTGKKRQSGFTALELSVVLIIISLMVGSTLILGNVRIEQEKVESTKKRIALIEKALIAYSEINQRLPCPSYPTLKNGDAMFGIASNNPGDCRTGTPNTTWFTTNTAIGSIPATTLGLPTDAMYDAWGRRFTYAVHLPMTLPNAFTFNSLDSSCGGLKIAGDTGAVSVPNAIFVILSHGADGHGAFNTNGVRVNANITNASALVNANTNAAFATNATTVTDTYRSHDYFEDSASPLNRFDDVVSYRTRKNFILPGDAKLRNFSVNNNLTATGWAYVPEYTLPSGKIVPAFEVMKYLASRDGDIPVSRPLTAPWTGLTFSQARTACQNLGGYEPTAGGGSNLLTGQGNLMQYDVISETQWLSLAHQISEDSRNWVDGCYNPASSVMIGGHRDNSPANVLVASNDDEKGYHLTGNSADASAVSGNTAYKRSQRRTFYLPSGGVLWDFSGNASQWSYCDLQYAAGENHFYAASRADAGQPDNGYNQCLSGGQANSSVYFDNMGIGMNPGEHWYNSAVCIDNTTKNGMFRDLNPQNNLVSTNGSSPEHNVGTIFIGNLTTANGVVRGGDYQTGLAGGPFRLSLDAAPTLAQQGFRCVRSLAPRTPSPDSFTGLEVWYDASDLDGDGISEGTSEAGLQSVAACTKNVANLKNDGCVTVWRNKAQPRYHARSRKRNGGDAGSVNNMPTLKLNALNGRPAVNFNGVAGRAEWLDTWHGVNNDPVSDNGVGFRFDTLEQFTIFVVAKGKRLSGIFTANDDNANALGEGAVSIPYNMADDGSPENYVFLTSASYAGTDAGTNTNCQFPLATSAPGCKSGVINPACAMLTPSGSVVTSLGALPSIFSGVFNSNGGQNNGISAYINGQAQRANDSAVQIATGALRATAKSCDGDQVNITMILGAQRAYDFTTFANGDLAEVIIYSRALSALDRLKIEQYLSEKYTISVDEKK